MAVVGVEDKLKGQVPMAFAVVKGCRQVATPRAGPGPGKEVFATVDGILGAIWPSGPRALRDRPAQDPFR